MKKLKLILLLALAGPAVYAQQKPDTAAKTKELFVNAGLQYLSNLTYAGRHK